MPTSKRRRFLIRQRQKRKVKNQGGTAQLKEWSDKIKGKQRLEGLRAVTKNARKKQILPPNPKFGSFFEFKNVNIIERTFRERLRLLEKEPNEKDHENVAKSTLALLSLLRRHSEPHYFHTLRVTLMALEVAKQTGVQTRAIFYGSALHDVGKLVVRPELLSGRDITKEEYDEVKRHGPIGFELIEKEFPFSAAMAGLHHKAYAVRDDELHNRWSPSTIAYAKRVALTISVADYIDAALSRKQMKVKNEQLQGLSLLNQLVRQFPELTPQQLQTILESPLIASFYQKSSTK